MKTTLDDYLRVQAIRLNWFKAMNDYRKRKDMIGFMYAQLNYLYWDDELMQMPDKHCDEYLDLLDLAYGGE